MTTTTTEYISAEVSVTIHPFTFMAVPRALQYLRWLKRRHANWLEDCEQDARQGHRPHYCVHGTNQWTDYDNICGPCEDGMTVYEEALFLAHRDVNLTGQRFLAIKAMTELLDRSRDDLPRDTRGALTDWALEPLLKEI